MPGNLPWPPSRRAAEPPGRRAAGPPGRRAPCRRLRLRTQSTAPAVPGHERPTAVVTTPLDSRTSSAAHWRVVVGLAMFMNALDSSIVNVVLPAIHRDPHFTRSGLTWFVDAYLISFRELPPDGRSAGGPGGAQEGVPGRDHPVHAVLHGCLLYTSDAADEE